MAKCVIYSRVSTGDQDNQTQIDDLKKYAKTINLKVDKVFGETVSGYDLSKERYEYKSMKEYVVNNNIKHILIWELSRLGRSTLHTLKEIDFFSKENINIYFKKENLSTLSDNATNKLLLSLLSSVAELERNTILERTHRGMVKSAEQGKRIGFSIVPYGYKADENGYVVIDEVQAKIVREIYDMAERGMSISGIASNLNSRGIPTKYASMGKKRTLHNGKVVPIYWQNFSVNKILHGTIYKGERNFGGKLKVILPAIIDEEQWNKVQIRFEKKIGYIKRTKYDYLFKGKISCGNCRRAYINRTELRYPKHPSFYACSGKVDPGIKCRNGQFNANVFDEYVYDLLFRHPGVMLKVYNDTQAEFDIESKRGQINYYKTELETYENKRKRLIYLYKEGMIDEAELRSEQASIRNASVDVENKISKLNKELNTFTDKGLSETLTSYLTETDIKIKLEFVQKYVDDIFIYNVKNTDIDFEKLTHTKMNGMKTINLRKPRLNEKMVYVEVFAFGASKPQKLVMTSWTRNCYTSDDLYYKDEYLTILNSSENI